MTRAACLTQLQAEIAAFVRWQAEYRDRGIVIPPTKRTEAMTTNEETDATNGETITWTITPRVYTGEWPDDIVDVENMREWTVDMPADADYSDLDILRACPDYRPVTEWALDARWVEEECVEYLRVVYEISADDYPPSEVEKSGRRIHRTTSTKSSPPCTPL